MIAHKIEVSKPITYREALKAVEAQNYFGYHPAGYGGWLADGSRVQVLPSDKTPRTLWYWVHWDSCS